MPFTDVLSVRRAAKEVEYRYGISPLYEVSLQDVATDERISLELSGRCASQLAAQLATEEDRMEMERRMRRPLRRE